MSESKNTGHSTSKENHIVDFVEVRRKRLEEKKRKTDRIVFHSLFSAYAVEFGNRLRPLEVVDMSEEGCSFQLPVDQNEIWPKDSKEFPLRLYFTGETYLEIFVRIQNSSASIDGAKRYQRYGCKIDAGTQSYPAFLAFVQFIRLYAQESHFEVPKVGPTFW